MKPISRQRRDELVDALRRGTVPMQSLDLLAVGLENFAPVLSEELETIKAGGAKFKAVLAENTARVRPFFPAAPRRARPPIGFCHLRGSDFRNGNTPT